MSPLDRKIVNSKDVIDWLLDMPDDINAVKAICVIRQMNESILTWIRLHDEIHNKHLDLQTIIEKMEKEARDEY